MNELDYAVIALLLISIASASVRGAIREIINIGGWVLAFILAHTFASVLATLFCRLDG